MLNIAYAEGRRIGEKIAEDIKSGKLQMPENETMQILIDKIFDYDFPLYQKILAKFGSPEFSMTGNLTCAGGGIAIGGVSIIKYCKTRNMVARVCYGASTICGGTAAVAGCLKAYSGGCGLSFFAVGGDRIGGAFLYVGNKAQKIGDMVDGKKRWSSPFRPRTLTRSPTKTGMGYRDLSFVTGPGNFSLEGVQQIVENIPYQEIIIVGGTVFTIYGYVKLLMASYKYLNSKFSPKIDKSKLIQNSALFLVDSIKKTESMKRVDRIYVVALKMKYPISNKMC